MNDTNLNEFIEAVNADIDKKIEEIQVCAEELRISLLENAEDEALNNAYIKIKSCVTEEKNKSKIAVSKAEQEARVRVLTYRENLVDKIFNNIYDKLVHFTESEVYKTYLQSLLKDEKTDEDTIVYLREEDMRFEEMLRDVTGPSCTFETDSRIELGGLSVFDRKRSVLNNKTLDIMFEEQKKNFSSNYRLA